MATSTSPQTKQVLIQFVVDDSELKSSIDNLTKTGVIDQQLANSFKQTTTEVNKQAAALRNVAATTPQVKKSLADLDEQTKKTSETFLTSFQEGVMDTLKEAGLSLQDFVELLKKGPQAAAPATETLRKQLRSLTEQLQQLKKAGQDNTEQYKQLVNQAGRLKDAMSDAQKEVRDAASDTGVFDGMISAVSGVAGAFAVAEGTAALFGSKSEELQKTLLKVNAAMAIVQGLQQVGTVLQKESAASRLLDVTATKIQIGVQKLYAIVVGESTGALKAFRLALATTGIGLLIIGLTTLIASMSDTADATEDVNKELERQKELITADTDAIKQMTELQAKQADVAGKKQSEVIRIQGEGLLKQRAILQQSNIDLDKQRKGLSSSSDAYLILNKTIEDNNKAIKDIDFQLQLKKLDLQKQINDEAKKASEDAKKAAEDSAKAQKEAREREINDEIAAIKIRLLSVDKGSVEELRLLQQKLGLEARLETENEKLTQLQKREIILKANADKLQLEKDFNEKLRKDAIDAQISRNNAELSSLKTNNEDRLLLTISNIELTATKEVDAETGNAAKIKEIYAKRDSDIRDAKKKFIDEQTEYEISLTDLANEANIRAARRLAADEQQNSRVRIAAIHQVADAEIADIDKRLAALNEEKSQKVISDQDYTKEYLKLLNEKEKITEDAEKNTTEIIKAENAKRKQEIRNNIRILVDLAGQVTDIFTSFNNLQKANDQQRIDSEKARIQSLLEAGAISQKEADRRNKRLDAEDKRLRQMQAQRDKQAEVFKAALQIPQAYLTGLAQGGPILGAVYAALAAVQAALIAARPIPKFFKGKSRGEYEGLAEIGERGPELVESGGRMFVAEKPQIVWLAKEDVVYNPRRTEEILSGAAHFTSPTIISYRQPDHKNGIEYEKFARIIAREIGRMPQTNLSLDKHGFDLSIQKGLARIEYMKNKYWRS